MKTFMETKAMCKFYVSDVIYMKIMIVFFANYILEQMGDCHLDSAV